MICIGCAIKTSDNKEWLIVDESEDYWEGFNGNYCANIHKKYNVQKIPLTDYMKTFAMLDYERWKENNKSTTLRLYFSYIQKPVATNININYSLTKNYQQ
jgi:hypothetical protein